MSTSQGTLQAANAEHNRADVTQDSASLIGRILLSAIFILSGVSKLVAPAMMVGYIRSTEPPS